MATRTVTGTISKPNGAPWAGALLYVKLIDDTFTVSPPETFPPATIAYAAGDDGVVTMELVSGLDKNYRVYLPSREYFDITVPDGAATTLELLRAATVGTPAALDNVEAALQALVPYFNVRDYGAVGGDVTLDHAALVAAITAADDAGGGVVYCPGEVAYLTSGNLGGAASNITIRGDGWLTSAIKLADGEDAHTFDISGNNWHFEHIEIDGNAAENSSGHGIRISGDYHSTNWVFIHDTVGYGMGCAQGDGTSLRYADFNHMLVMNAGTDGIDIKDKDSSNVGNRLDNILVISPDRSGAGDVAGIDLRGHVQLTNIAVLDIDSSNGAGIRFRAYSESTGPVGGRRSTLTNFYVLGDLAVNASGVAIQAEDISVSNGTVVNCGRGVSTGADGYNASISNVTEIDCWVTGFDINATLGGTLSACRASGSPTNFNIVGSDTTLLGCVSRDADTIGVDVAGDRTILAGCRVYGSAGTALRFQSGADNSYVSGCDFTGQSGGTKITNAGAGNVFRDNIASGLAETVFNDAGDDVDFRVEGDTATNLFVVDAGSNEVHIGTTVAGAIAQFKSTAIVFNENSADIDLRIESDGNSTMFVVDAGTNRVGIGANSPQTVLDVNDDSIRIRTALTPASAGATGVQGEIAWDADFLYVAVGTNTWKRVAIATWP